MAGSEHGHRRTDGFSLAGANESGLRIKGTNPEEVRHFSMPEWALDVLEQHRAEQDRDRALFGADYQDNDLIFCQPHGAYYSPDRAGARVVELMRKVGLKGVSLHSLRHSHASSLLSKGVRIAVVSERLGHADQNITLSIYSPAMPADKRAPAKIWNDAMAERDRYDSENWSARDVSKCLQESASEIENCWN